ncbi:helix-turn-helix domain-containing protein [Paenibacillus enshidis]|uniref:Helix-turn-helix domain-containing protein n=1 Tax=Paenibacillus enshidis TaxID=1458439 RepID=A0ABV5AYU1_9BACL
MRVPTPTFTQGESAMSYTHRSIIERGKLEILHQQGESARAIARELGRPHPISLELRRNAAQEPYQAEASQESYVQRRKASMETRDVIAAKTFR